MPTCYGLSQYAAPTSTPVTLAEARTQCGLPEDYAAHDVLLLRLIKAATRYVENRTGRSLIAQTWDFSLDEWPDGNEPIYLPRAAPLSSVTFIKYYDTNGTQQTWSSSNYSVLTDREPGQIRLAYDCSYPAYQMRPATISIRYVAGASSASSVPEELRAAVLLLVCHWFEQRSSEVIGTINSSLSHTLDALLTMSLVGEEFLSYSAEYDD